MESGSVMFSRLSQPSNACAPMMNTEFGIVMLLRFLH